MEFFEQLNDLQMPKKKFAPLFVPPWIQTSLTDFDNMWYKSTLIADESYIYDGIFIAKITWGISIMFFTKMYTKLRIEFGVHTRR
jgi:hypothetical protein